MPHRHKFPTEHFATNPYESVDLDTVYERLQWGNSPRNRYKMEAPEPLAALGTLAQVKYVNGKSQRFREDSYYAAVGQNSNRLYFVPICPNGSPEDFPRNFYRRLNKYGLVKQTDYLSDKGTDRGGQAGYYYHAHESPYPMLCGNGSHYVLAPQRHKDGGRSYAIHDEGIIG